MNCEILILTDNQNKITNLPSGLKILYLSKHIDISMIKIPFGCEIKYDLHMNRKSKEERLCRLIVQLANHDNYKLYKGSLMYYDIINDTSMNFYTRYIIESWMGDYIKFPMDYCYNIDYSRFEYNIDPKGINIHIY